jgi:hypothetical protein
VDAGELSPEHATPAPASPDPQEPSSALRTEAAPAARCGDWRLAARVPKHLGAGRSGPGALPGVAAGASADAPPPGSAPGEGSEGAAPQPHVDGAVQAPAGAWDVRDDDAVWRVKVRECFASACAGCTRAAQALTRHCFPLRALPRGRSR